MYTFLKITTIVLTLFLILNIVFVIKLIQANKEIEKLQKEKQNALKLKEYYLNIVNQYIEQDSYYDLGER